MKKQGRILCVTSNFPRWHGDSTTPFVLNLATGLTELGWQVDVLAPHAPDAKLFETFEKVKVHRFRYCWPESQQTVCYQGGALVNLRKSAFNKVKLPILVFAQFIAMFSRLVVGKYDVIHAHWLLPQGFNAVLLGKLFGLPVVVTVHGGDIFGLQGSLIDLFKKLVINWLSVITVNSRFTGDAVRKLYPDDCRIEKIPMGVLVGELTAEQKRLTNKFRSRYRRGKGPLIIFVGRLVDEKGIADLLESVALVVRDASDTSVLIAGEGQDRSKFEKLANSLGVADRCHFVGWVPSSEVRSYMAAGDYFVGPSRTAVDGWVEAQGLTFLEAMASGTLVIGTKLGGIKESIIDGETGFLVDEKNPEQIASVIVSSNGSESAVRSIKKSAKQFVEQNFSHELVASRFSALFLSERKKTG